METTTCAICGRVMEGILITHKRYIDKVFTLDQYKIGFQCQNCGACICTAGKKKDHPYGKFSLKKKDFHCPKCGERFEPSHVLFKKDAPVNEELRAMLGETGPSIEPRTFNQISEIFDRKKWRKDENLQRQLLEQLKVDGEGYIYRCLEELVDEIEKVTPSNTNSIGGGDAKNRILRISWLAEIGAGWLFEDGLAEDMLIYIVEQMKDNIRDDDQHDNGEHPGTTFDLLIVALWQIERAAKSGKSIPAITNILLNDHSVYYRSVTALLLKFITWDPRVVDALIEALHDEKRPSRLHGGSLTSPNPNSVHERAVFSLIEFLSGLPATTYMESVIGYQSASSVTRK